MFIRSKWHTLCKDGILIEGLDRPHQSFPLTSSNANKTKPRHIQTHSNGISALQLQKQLGSNKLRASMVDPERNCGPHEASLRTKDDPPTGGQGAATARCHRRRHRTRGRKHPRRRGWPKSPPTATSDTSETAADDAIAKSNLTLRSPPIVPCPDSPAVDPQSLLQPQRMGDLPRAAIRAGLSRSSSFASTAAKPATLPRSSASPNAEPLTYSMLIEPPC